jgi:hypothetical protein
MSEAGRAPTHRELISKLDGGEFRRGAVIPLADATLTVLQGSAGMFGDTAANLR